MVYDAALADRIRRATGPRPGVTEKAMFGGLAFFRGGKMFVGVVKDQLMVRVGKDRHGEAMAKPHVRPMDFTGRPMEGYVFVEPPGVTTTEQIVPWVEWGLATLERLAPRARAKKAGKQVEAGAGRRRS